MNDQQPADTNPKPSALRTWIPALGFWQGRNTFIADLLAGTTVGLVLVPQAMAYAALAGMPPVTGLYASTFACMAGGIFGRCAQLQTGPVAMTSLIAFSTVAAITPPVIDGEANPEYLGAMAVLALLVGVLRIGLGLVKGAILATLVSKPVLIGLVPLLVLLLPARKCQNGFKQTLGTLTQIINSIFSLRGFSEVRIGHP